MADKQESALTQQSDCKWVRALDANGNSIRISKEDLAAVVGGLIGTATSLKDGLMSSNLYTYVSSYQPPSQVNKFTHLFTLTLYSHVCFYLKLGNVTSTYLCNCSIIDLQNRSAGDSVGVVVGKVEIFSNQLEGNLYARKNSNNSIDVFVKQVDQQYAAVKLACIFVSGGWTYVGAVSDVSESELTKIL